MEIPRYNLLDTLNFTPLIMNKEEQDSFYQNLLNKKKIH